MGFVFQDLEIIRNEELACSNPLRRSPSQSQHFQLVFPVKRILVWLTYWLDYQFYKLNAVQWRRTSMVLHAINGLLLLTLFPVAAFLFFVHPLTTMGSSYVAGRSGLMSGTFQIMVILATLGGHWGIAIAIAVVASLWLKEDSVIFFPMILGLWVAQRA